MFAAIRSRLLRVLRVPHDPEPPFGAPGSLKVFRAAKNFYYVRLLAWLIAQVGATIGIIVSVFFLTGLRREYDTVQSAREQRAAVAASAPAQPTAAPAPDTTSDSAPAAVSTATDVPAKTALPKKNVRTKKNRENAKRAFVERTPRWVLPLIELLELAGIAAFLFQLPVTYAAVRLDWEMRWYIVTDRSLRIRAGIWSLQESTMSFANLQQVEVRQGPLQRLLGIADVIVQSAGGGGGGGGHEKGASHDSLHTGTFHGVDNAQEIRDLVLERLRLFRQTGLGDPDEAHAIASEPATSPENPAASDVRAAAQELLAEARALRSAATDA
jgi:hypothetical protein